MRRFAAARGAALILATGVGAGLACGWLPHGAEEKPPAPGDLAGIGKLDDAFLDAYNEGDADRLAALFTDDAVLVPSDDPTCEGRDAIADYYDDLLRDEPATAEFKVQETKVFEVWAYERIDVKVDWTDPDTGEDVETLERYFWVLRHESDGTWKIARLIVNTEEPGDEEDEDQRDGRRA